MQLNSKVLTIAALSLGVVSAVAPAIWAHGDARASQKGKSQNITITVDGSGYHPSMVNLKAGKPVHMTFVSKGEGCANSISIPALKKTINLKKGQKKEIAWTPKKGQTVAFACSMKMFKGKAVAK